MSQVYDYDDETGDVEILPDVPQERTFTDSWLELDFPSRHVYSYEVREGWYAYRP